MNARRFQRAWAHGRRQAERLEPRLQEQYEAAIRAAGNRAVKAYKAAAIVTLAAANPTMQEVLDARVLEEAALARTAATRKRIAEAASVVAVESAEARRLISPLLKTLVDQQAGKQAARLVAGAQEAVATVMLDSLTEGWSVPRTADALRERFSEFSRTQSTMLARTDLISLSNGASLATATSLGDEAPNFKTWLATSDDRTRPDHDEANGQSVPFDQPFDVGGVPMMYPGDPDGPDDSTINCRCTLIYEDEPAAQLLHSEEGGIIAAATEEEPVPWKVLERDGEFCVTKSDTGETVKCHPTEDQALAHQRALYANEPEVAAANGDTTDEIIACAYCAENGCAQEAAQNASAGCCQDEALVGENLGSLLAAIPVAPPSEWFEFPETDEPTPITITADGHIYGHAALWGTCHTGFPGRCRTAPASPSGYRYYHLGAVDTADGKTVPVGNITLGTGHASLTAARSEVAAHYDNTGMVAADVVARDGALGIWVSGALRPGVTEEQIRTLRAAKLSGDWRGVNGALEMIGLLAVNVPGFPVPRPTAALAASGETEEIVALLAAGIVGEDETDEVTEEEFLIQMRVLTARAIGLDELVAAGLGETDQERRLRVSKAARPFRPLTAATTITITVDDAKPDVMALGEAVDREIAYRVAFFADHGYWPATPQSGAVLSAAEWQESQDKAAELVTDPDNSEMRALRQRILDRGFLVA